MSGNIHDTNISELKQEVYNLCNQLKTTRLVNETDLQTKYKYLYTTSKTLFKFIISNYQKPDFDEELFNKNLDVMLTQILKIQNSQTSQHTASEFVGTHLAYTYVPQFKK
jgi:hypothetical protein